jgi:uncharacterized RDD family membrane protein YckC
MSTSTLISQSASDPSLAASPHYAGFWIRTAAGLIDTALWLAITLPLLYFTYGAEYFDQESPELSYGVVDFVLTWIAPMVVTVLFWLGKQGTPGKLMLSLRVVDAWTGKALTPGQSLGRYLGYVPALLVLGLGVIWIGFDARKQGWHDKLAKTLVVRVSKPTA